MSSKMVVPVVPLSAGAMGGWVCDVVLGPGYVPLTVKRALRDGARLSRWLEGEGLGVGELTAQRAEEFLRAQRAGG